MLIFFLVIMQLKNIISFSGKYVNCLKIYKGYSFFEESTFFLKRWSFFGYENLGYYDLTLYTVYTKKGNTKLKILR